MNTWNDEGKNYYEMSQKELDKHAATAADLFLEENPGFLSDP